MDFFSPVLLSGSCFFRLPHSLASPRFVISSPVIDLRDYSIFIGLLYCIPFSGLLLDLFLVLFSYPKRETPDSSLSIGRVLKQMRFIFGSYGACSKLLIKSMP